MPIRNGMRVLATAEVLSHVAERGGMLFVWVKKRRAIRGALRLLLTSTEPPADALDWQRVEAKGFLVFLPPGMRLPKELHLVVKGVLQRRVEAFWEGCAFAA
jgi:hypothetical protein